ncbi:MAG: hypothetical protein RLZZ354_532 [Pseudomonadota bacterium]|jgi:hypothetical protein
MNSLPLYDVINEMKNRFIIEEKNNYDIITIKPTKKFYVYELN